MPEPVDIVRSIFAQPLDMVALLEEGAAPGRTMLAAATTDDVEFEFLGPPENETGVAAELSGPTRGPDALVESWRSWLEPYSAYVVELREARALAEDSVFAEVEATVRTATGDVEVRQRQGALFDFRGERIRRWRAWLHASDARAALGLE